MPKFESLPSESIMHIMEYSDKSSIRSLMTSCTFNLAVCQKYIHMIVNPLLNAGIHIQPLLKVPLTDPIRINSSEMHQYFINKSVSSSKYIGVDSTTNHTFISFCLKAVRTRFPPLKFVTVSFDQNGVSDVLVAQRLFGDWYLHHRTCLRCHTSKSHDIRIINDLLHRNYKKVKRILDSDTTEWCLYHQWQKAIFWPKLQYHFKPVTQLFRYAGALTTLGVILYFIMHYIVVPASQ
eukprot:23737_1